MFWLAFETITGSWMAGCMPELEAVGFSETAEACSNSVTFSGGPRGVPKELLHELLRDGSELLHELLRDGNELLHELPRERQLDSSAQ